MSRGIFVTGTDTGVGKTIVAAALTRLLRLKGVNAGVMKPVTSGCREERGSLVSDDALLLCRAAGLSCSDDSAPYLLREPLAPAEAAKLDGVRIDAGRIKESYDRLAARHEVVIVEGAGGLMVPLAEQLMTTDLIKLLDLPLLVVARSELGTVNHTLLTCFSAQQLGLAVAGVVVNNYPETPDLAEQGAPRQIEVLSGAPLLGVWPHFNDQAGGWRLEAGGGTAGGGTAGGGTAGGLEAGRLEAGRLEAGRLEAGRLEAGRLEGRYAVVERLAGWLNEQPETDGMLRILGVANVFN